MRTIVFALLLCLSGGGVATMHTADSMPAAQASAQRRLTILVIPRNQTHP